MRTTVTLEPDVDRLLKRSMRERRIGFKQALNEAVRRGLGAEAATEYDFPTYDMGPPLVDLTKTSEILGALDDEEFLRITREAR